jgi:hypothetical protein
MKTDVYERITGAIVAKLERGVRPWTKSWNAEHAAGRIRMPAAREVNYVTGGCRPHGQVKLNPRAPLVRACPPPAVRPFWRARIPTIACGISGWWHRWVNAALTTLRPGSPRGIEQFHRCADRLRPEAALA